MTDEFKIGAYTLRHVTCNEGKGPFYMPTPHIFIQHVSGEGLSVRESAFAAWLDEQFKDF